MLDQIKMRPWGERARVALDKMLSRGEPTPHVMAMGINSQVLMVNAFCGSGKTLVAMDIINALFRRELIDAALILTPRINLCRQYEFSWNARFRDLYAGRTFGKVIHKGNDPPLLHPELDGIPQQGVATTYSSLCSKPSLWLDFCSNNRRVALIPDEAQILGSTLIDSIESDGTQAAEHVKELARICPYVIPMTGTPTRSDESPLLFGRYLPPNSDGLRMLDADVEATYREGVENHYIRMIDCIVQDGECTQQFIDNDEKELIIVSQAMRGLKAILKQPAFWQPLVDRGVEEIRGIRSKLDPRFKGIFGACDQTQAREMLKYLQSRHGDLSWVMAISDEDASIAVMERFKADDSAGLVSVGMPYVGYDNPWITVVVVAGPFRHFGWLDQFAFRGGRVVDGIPYDRQVLLVIGPSDPLFMQWARMRRADSRVGIRDKDTRDNSGEREMPTPRASYVIPSSTKVTSRAALLYQNEENLTPLQTGQIEAFAARYRLNGTPMSDLVRLFLDINGGIWPTLEESSIADAEAPSDHYVADSDLIKILRREIKVEASKATTMMRSATPGIEWSWGFEQIHQQFNIESITNQSAYTLKEILAWVRGTLIPRVQAYVDRRAS